MKKSFLSLLGLVLLFSACEKEQCDQEVPTVSFNEIRKSTTTTVVVLNVFDCDGDIGLTQDDVGGEFRYNAFIDIRPWVNGKWADDTYDYSDTTYTEILNDSGIVIGYDTIIDTLNFYYRVPVVENESRSDIYEAKIELDLGASFFGFDTFRFEARIRDRRLNESNVAESKTQISYF
ncbi:MAG: hypothetical protein ACPGEG_04585 [Salibacteraceae bacterium]